MKKVLSILLSLVALVSVFNCAITSYADTVIKTDYDELYYSYYNGGGFEIGQRSAIKIKFSADAYCDFYLYEAGNYNYELFVQKFTKGVETTVILPAGDYEYEAIYVDEDYYDDPHYYVEVTDVSVQPTSITMKTKKKNLSVGGSFKLSYVLGPSGAIYGRESYWSSNTSVASEYEGEVFANNLGKCKVYAKIPNGKTAACTVTVNSCDLYLLNNMSIPLPKINGNKKVKWKSGNSAVAAVKGQKVRGKKAGSVTLNTTYKKTKYKTKIRVVDYNKMLKKCKSNLRDRLLDPDSLKIYHIWCGYNDDGYPAIWLDYGAKNPFGAYVRGNYKGYYYDYNKKSKKFKFDGYTSDYRGSLRYEKKVK